MGCQAQGRGVGSQSRGGARLQLRGWVHRPPRSWPRPRPLRAIMILGGSSCEISVPVRTRTRNDNAWAQGCPCWPKAGPRTCLHWMRTPASIAGTGGPRLMPDRMANDACSRKTQVAEMPWWHATVLARSSNSTTTLPTTGDTYSQPAYRVHTTLIHPANSLHECVLQPTPTPVAGVAIGTLLFRKQTAQASLASSSEDAAMISGNCCCSRSRISSPAAR